jgi:phosphoesterase family protein
MRERAPRRIAMRLIPECRARARIQLALLVAAAVAAIARTAAAEPPKKPSGGAFPRYDHVFLIVEENHGFSQIIGNPAAPNLNRLASTYGLATASFSVADPSAPNYVAMLGGSFFGIADNNAYYLHTVDKPSLMSQLEAAHLSWKGYLQSMPYAGFKGICYPNRCNGVPDFDTLYNSKHNGIPYFKSIQTNPAEMAKMGPLTALARDLAAGPPSFGYIVPDECSDMHGAPPYCVDSGDPGDESDNALVGIADKLAGKLVDQITRAPFWAHGNNAIVITFDEGADGDTSGCCGTDPGNGRVATIVITSHGPRGLEDPTPYNHFSLLQSMQRAFGLGCLEQTCDTANIVPMTPLFKVQ